MEICLTPNSSVESIGLGPPAKRTGQPSVPFITSCSPLSFGHSSNPTPTRMYANPHHLPSSTSSSLAAPTPETESARARARKDSRAGQVEAGVRALRPPRHGQRSRGEVASGQGDDGGRRDVPVQDPGGGGGGAARPPGAPAPGVGGGAAPGRARAPDGPRRAAQAREALLPGADPPRRRLGRRGPARAAQDVVGRAARRRPGAAGEPDAVPAHGVGRGGVHRAVVGRAARRHEQAAAEAAVVRGGGRGRRGAAADAPAQGRGGAADEGEQGPRRGRRADHAALRRQGPGPGRRHHHHHAAGLRAAVRQEPDAAAGLLEETEADEVHGRSRRDHRMTAMLKPLRSTTLVLPFSLLDQQDAWVAGVIWNMRSRSDTIGFLSNLPSNSHPVLSLLGRSPSTNFNPLCFHR